MIYGFTAGGAWQAGIDAAQAAGVHLVRSHDLETSMTVQELQDRVLYGAQRGVRLLLMYNEDTPDMPIGNLVAQMARVGPNGTLWNSGQPGAGLGAFAPTHIEVGNEWSYSYRGDQVTPAIGIANSVQRFYNAVGTGTAHGMKFICEGEDAGSGSDQFMNQLLATVPTIRTMLDGWTVHGYGPSGGNEPNAGGGTATQYGSITRLNARLIAKGFTGDKIWITENGIATDNGASLTNNYGWNVNKTYSQAATDILAHVRLIGNSLSFSSRIYAYFQYKGNDNTVPGANNDRENYFGLYQVSGAAKGAYSSAAVTLAAEFPATVAPPSTTPTPGGAVAGGNAPTEPGGLSGIISFVSQAGTSFLPAADPWVVTGPGSGQAGDFVVIGLVQGNQGTTVVSAPAGFTSDGTATEGTDGRLRIYRGHFSVVGAGPYSFDMSGAITGYAVCTYYRGVHTTTPLDAVSIYSATASSTAWASNTITPANTGAMIVAIAACSPGGAGRTTTVTSPAIKRGAGDNGDGLYVVADKLLTTIAATTIAGTISVAETMAVGTLALRAAPVVVIPPTTETPVPGGALADGRTAVARALSPAGGSGEAQGVGTASATYPSLVTYPSPNTYPSPFAVGLRARSGITAGGAVSGGFAPPVGAPVSQSPTPGGAVAGGFGVVARALVPRGAATAGGAAPAEIQAAIPGGAVADGRAPAPRATSAAGGAVGAGQAQGERTAVLPGGAVAGAPAPLVRTSLTAGGAIAAGNAPGERISVSPPPGGAVAAGNAPVIRSAVTAGGQLADGFSGTVGAKPRVAVAQGGAVAAGNAPARADLAVAGGAVAAGASPTARTTVPVGAAGAGGFDFSESAPPPITTIGGAIADGTAVSVRSAVTAGGATAAGTAPIPQTSASPTPGGADVGGNAPSASVASSTGAASGAGNGAGSITPLTAGGALAGGLDLQASESSETPPPGAATAAGVGPHAWTTIAVGGAIAATNTLTGATVLITPGGALAGGRIPYAPFVVSRHFDDDEGPVLAGSFDPGTQRGQT